MKHTVRDFTLELIDEPLQSHVVAWERAARAQRNDEAKPHLIGILAELKKIEIGKTNLRQLVSLFIAVSEAITAALNIIETNETLTLSANSGAMVKAAVISEWIVSPTLTPDDIDHMQPWLVRWIAERVAVLYNEVTTIPPN